MKADHLSQAVVVIRERINKSGLEEAEIRQGGNDRIILQIPGYADKESAEKLLTQVGYLEFALVSEDQSKLGLALKGKTIPGYRLLYVKSGREGEAVSQPLLVKDKAEFDGTYLSSSSVGFGGQFREPQVNLEFNSKGAKLFANVTRQNINRQLAIILDDKVVSAPVIKSEIPGGRAMIEGKFTLDEAKELSLILNAGALPAKIIVLSSSLVSASLGKDSISRGLQASIFGLILVGLFVVIYYLKPGVIAIFALLVNMFCLLGVLVGMGAVMTLPGIAGLILTFGMAIDSNVLIYERMREELLLGKRVNSAIKAGFEKALAAIVDSNLTTLLTSIILYRFGSGPVKGFAIVLIIGIATTIFAS